MGARSHETRTIPTLIRSHEHPRTNTPTRTLPRTPHTILAYRHFELVSPKMIDPRDQTQTRPMYNSAIPAVKRDSKDFYLKPDQITTVSKQPLADPPEPPK